MEKANQAKVRFIQLYNEYDRYAMMCCLFLMCVIQEENVAHVQQR